MTNSSGITPYGFNVLVQFKKGADRTTGGLYLPESVKDRDDAACQTGTLVAKGSNAGDYLEGATFPDVGSRVVVKKFASMYELRGDDGFEYRLCEDRDILAVLET
jgi:co-chaperonin GroES (HSP10)